MTGSLTQLRRVLALPVLLMVAGFPIGGYRALESSREYHAAAGFEIPSSSAATTKRKINVHNAEQVDPHYSHISILPLLPWEVETIFNHKIRETNAPRNIPKTCALGSISRGGYTFPSANCGGGKPTYDRVQQRVQEWLPEDGVCDTCRILDIMTEKNLTLSFWGDSVQVRTCLYSVNASTLARICL
jgi:hypothetical protein